METDELWHRGPWPQKTTQPEAHKRGAVLTPFLFLPPSLPPSPSHHPVTKEARGARWTRTTLSLCVGRSRSPRRPPRCVTPPPSRADPAQGLGPLSPCPCAALAVLCVLCCCQTCWATVTPAQGELPLPRALIKGRRSAEAANRCYHCSRVLIDFNYTHIRFLVLLSRCRRLCRTVDNVYPLDLFYWFVCLGLFVFFF